MNLFDASEFGIFPGSSDQYSVRIQEVLNHLPPESCLRFLPVEYDFLPGSSIPFSLHVSNSYQSDNLYAAVFGNGLNHIHLDWQGSHLIFHEDLSPFVFLNCSDIQIHNLSIDWKVPFSAEATVVNACKEWVDITIDAQQYSHRIEDGALLFLQENGTETPLFGVMEFDHSTHKVRAGAGDTFPGNTIAVPADNDMIRLKGSFSIPPEVGNILVLRHGKRIHPGFLADHCNDIQIQNIQVHHTAGLGMLFQFCRNIDVVQTDFIPSPSSGRKILSGHDDGLHFSNCMGKILVEHCNFYGLMDDSINVHGTSVKILEKISPHVLRCGYIHPQSYGFPKWACSGDHISCLDHKTLKSLGERTVSSFRLLNEKEFEITFLEPLPELLHAGDALENITNTPSLLCQYNYFGSCRARGVLVTTPQPVEIHHNFFESSGSAILLSGDANQWYESGACQKVSIHHNLFLECCTSQYQFCSGIISIEPEILDPQENYSFHQNLVISENTFVSKENHPCVYAKCSSGVHFINNTIFCTNSSLPVLDHSFCREISSANNIMQLLGR